MRKQQNIDSGSFLLILHRDAISFLTPKTFFHFDVHGVWPQHFLTEGLPGAWKDSISQHRLQRLPSFLSHQWNWGGQEREKRGHCLGSFLLYSAYSFSSIVHTNHSFRTWELKEDSLKGYAEFYKSYFFAPCAVSSQIWTTFINSLTNVSCGTFHAASVFFTHFCLISCVMLQVHQKEISAHNCCLNPKRPKFKLYGKSKIWCAEWKMWFLYFIHQYLWFYF